MHNLEHKRGEDSMGGFAAVYRCEAWAAHRTLVEPLKVVPLSRPCQVQYSTWTMSCAEAGSTPSLMQDSSFCCQDSLAACDCVCCTVLLLSASDLLEICHCDESRKQIRKMQKTSNSCVHDTCVEGQG